VLKKIISGGQTGADRAALEWAIRHKVPHGGFCPKGRKAEDGRIPEMYRLSELATSSYRERTERNVVASDGTLIVTWAKKLSGGSARAAHFCAVHGKPMLHIHETTERAGVWVRAFLKQHKISTLNIAGPRVSAAPGVAGLVTNILDGALREEALPHRRASPNGTSESKAVQPPSVSSSLKELQKLFFLASDLERLEEAFLSQLKGILGGMKGDEQLVCARCKRSTCDASASRWAGLKQAAEMVKVNRLKGKPTEKARSAARI